MTVVTTKTETTTTISSPLLERKIQETAAGLADYYTKRFLSIGSSNDIRSRLSKQKGRD
jgi:hypothetical protein